MINRAIFLDRDGTLNRDTSYINTPADFEFYEFAPSALKILKNAGFLLILVSNQSGVGRGIISEKNLADITAKMRDLLAAHNLKFDAVYYSFYYERAVEPKYLQNPEYRKPEPGMLLKAAREFNITLTESYMIGDRQSDMLAGKNSGCKTILVKTGDGCKSLKTINSTRQGIPDYIFDNILDAAKFIAELNGI